MPVPTRPQKSPVGVQSYYQAKIESSELLINQKTQNLRRLEAQRNALNARGTYDATLARAGMGDERNGSEVASGRVAAASRAGELCRRSRQGDG